MINEKNVKEIMEKLLNNENDLDDKYSYFPKNPEYLMNRLRDMNLYQDELRKNYSTEDIDEAERRIDDMYKNENHN